MSLSLTKKGDFAPLSALPTPSTIGTENAATAYFHCLGAEDKAAILARVLPAEEVAAAIEVYTHLVSRWGNLAEVWATASPKPYTPRAIYTRIS